METETLSNEELIEKVKNQELIISQLQNQLEDYKIQLKNEKISHVKLVCDFEIEEEKAANTLLRKLENVNKEKQKILQEMEKEEEYMTNSLLKKLQEVSFSNRYQISFFLSFNLFLNPLFFHQLTYQSQSQKIKMENELEKEEEYITNKLQAKIRELSEAN